MKENKLIAEFMGYAKDSDELYLIDDYNLRSEEEYQATYVSEMKFHCSWDWLMPVAQKIYDEGEFDNELVLLIRDSVAELNLKNTYESIIDYLKNLNNKMKDKNKITLDELKEKLIYYYEVDINNCEMTDKDWIEELARCMLYDDYKETFFRAYKEYVQERKP